MRIVLIILDSVGCGAQPDSAYYGDADANTIGNLARSIGGLHIPHLARLGIGNITPILGADPIEHPHAAYGKLTEKSPGKDTITGHWELMGVRLDRPFPVYPEGFPQSIIDAFTQAIGREVIGNEVASGTEIIARLGPEHVRSGKPIVYTSADSVFQIAAHEEVVPLQELYRYCTVARGILTGPHQVGRIIARPFVGEPGSYTRTANRRDYAIKPPYKTTLDLLSERGFGTWAIGKIEDIFVGQGISWAEHTKSNEHGIDLTIQLLKDGQEAGLIFTNLVEFDSVWGHRNDVPGYARGLEAFDRRLPEIQAAMNEDDVLIITADHGCDPTTPSTDHTREHVPLLIHGGSIPAGLPIGIRSSFSDLGATIAALFGLSELPMHGQPIWEVAQGVRGHKS